jgi:ribosomal protein S18 acetylase RimI-like enzyme
LCANPRLVTEVGSIAGGEPLCLDQKDKHVKIRIACQNDIESIKECINSAYKHYEVRLGIKPGPMLADYKKSIENDKTYVAEDVVLGIIGVLILVESEKKFLLENIAIHPSVQGRGYGKELLQFAEKTAQEFGFAYVELYTHKKMNENIILYQQIGYEIFNYVYENGYNRVYMRKLVKG